MEDLQVQTKLEISYQEIEGQIYEVAKNLVLDIENNVWVVGAKKAVPVELTKEQLLAKLQKQKQAILDAQTKKLEEVDTVVASAEALKAEAAENK